MWHLIVFNICLQYMIMAQTDFHIRTYTKVFQSYQIVSWHIILYICPFHQIYSGYAHIAQYFGFLILNILIIYKANNGWYSDIPERWRVSWLAGLCYGLPILLLSWRYLLLQWIAVYRVYECIWIWEGSNNMANGIADWILPMFRLVYSDYISMWHDKINIIFNYKWNQPLSVELFSLLI